jgi:uncharacterized glyoxalase superfamily protein PhnB
MDPVFRDGSARSAAERRDAGHQGSHVHPDVSIDVDDVDAVYDRARAARAEIVYPLTDEEWGLRRFFVRDPNGAVINVTEHS